MKVATSSVFGVLGYVLGGIVATILVAALITVVGTTGDPRGGETAYKVAWSAIVFGIGPLSTAAFPLAIGGRRVGPEVLALAVVIALALYSLTAWALAPMLSAGNDCMVGVTWPDTSVAGCD